MAKVTILGAGGWAIGIAVLLDNNGHDVTMWSAVSTEVKSLKRHRENKISLPGIVISEKIKVTGDLDESLKDDPDIIILAVASKFIRSTAKLLNGKIKEGQIILNVAKGIEDGTLMFLTDVIEEELPDSDVCVLSGPTHAEEVGKLMPTTCVVGAKSEKTAKYIQDVFASQYFRTYVSPDMVGIELCGALKNVIALAAGMADGLGYGDNTKAALITRGIKEITRLGLAMGANVSTFAGLSGIGDLIVTCASMHSRNRRAGILIGQGYTLDEAVREVNMVVEGAVSAKAALELANKYKIEMPIIEEVNKILFEDLPVENAVQDLMLRQNIAEHPELVWNQQ